MSWKSMLAGVVLLAAVAATLGFFWPFGNGARVLRLPGLVEIQEVRLGSKIGGRVAEVLINEGDLVEAGQVLVRLEAPELEAQREQWQARVLAASAALERMRNGARSEDKQAAEAAAEAAQARYERLKNGSRIEDIRQAEAELKREEATADLAVRVDDPAAGVPLGLRFSRRLDAGVLPLPGPAGAGYLADRRGPWRDPPRRRARGTLASCPGALGHGPGDPGRQLAQVPQTGRVAPPNRQ